MKKPIRISQGVRQVGNRFQAYTCRIIEGKRKFISIGYFGTIEEAENARQSYKTENKIKKIKEKYC